MLGLPRRPSRTTWHAAPCHGDANRDPGRATQGGPAFPPPCRRDARSAGPLGSRLPARIEHRVDRPYVVAAVFTARERGTDRRWTRTRVILISLPPCAYPPENAPDLSHPCKGHSASNSPERPGGSARSLLALSPGLLLKAQLAVQHSQEGVGGHKIGVPLEKLPESRSPPESVPSGSTRVRASRGRRTDTGD